MSAGCACLAAGMIKHGLSAEEAVRKFWILDAGGLITDARGSIPDNVKPYARPANEGQTKEGDGLLAVVAEVRRQRPLHALGSRGP